MMFGTLTLEEFLDGMQWSPVHWTTDAEGANYCPICGEAIDYCQGHGSQRFHRIYFNASAFLFDSDENEYVSMVDIVHALNEYHDQLREGSE